MFRGFLLGLVVFALLSTPNFSSISSTYEYYLKRNFNYESFDREPIYRPRPIVQNIVQPIAPLPPIIQYVHSYEYLQQNFSRVVSHELSYKKSHLYKKSGFTERIYNPILQLNVIMSEILYFYGTNDIFTKTDYNFQFDYLLTDELLFNLENNNVRNGFQTIQPIYHSISSNVKDFRDGKEFYHFNDINMRDFKYYVDLDLFNNLDYSDDSFKFKGIIHNNYSVYNSINFHHEYYKPDLVDPNNNVRLYFDVKTRIVPPLFIEHSNTALLFIIPALILLTLIIYSKRLIKYYFLRHYYRLHHWWYRPVQKKYKYVVVEREVPIDDRKTDNEVIAELAEEIREKDHDLLHPQQSHQGSQFKFCTLDTFDTVDGDSMINHQQ